MDTKKTPLAVAVFAEVLLIFCAISVALFPGFTMKIFETWTHGINWGPIWNPSLNVVDLVIGFVSLFIFVYLATWIFVVIYKSIVK